MYRLTLETQPQIFFSRRLVFGSGTLTLIYMNNNNTKTYAVQHPDMSHALIIDAHEAHTVSYIVSMATMYMVQNFDVFLPKEEWALIEVDADREPFSLFE